MQLTELAGDSQESQEEGMKEGPEEVLIAVDMNSVMQPHVDTNSPYEAVDKGKANEDVRTSEGRLMRMKEPQRAGGWHLNTLLTPTEPTTLMGWVFRALMSYKENPHTLEEGLTYFWSLRS